MRVLSVSTFEQWQALAEPWNLLTRGMPFRGWEWLSTWWRHYGETRELAVLAILDDRGTMVGAAPWYIEQAVSRGRVLRMIGSGEVCSDYPSLLCTPEFENHVATAISQWLLGEGSLLHWDVLEIECVPHHDSAVCKLTDNLKQAGCSIVKTAGQKLWSIPLPETWQDYLAQLSKSHRKQINRLLRDYWDTGRACLQIAQTGEQLQRSMNLLEDLHERRWRLVGMPGVFASQRFGNFLREAANKLLLSQSLQVCVLELDGRPAAVDFHLVNAQASFAYQGGIEPELIEQSPGKLLTALMIQDAIHCRRRSFDFLRGDEPYKPHFRAVPTETLNVHIIPKRAAAQLRHGLWMTGLAMRNLVKSGLSYTGMN